MFGRTVHQSEGPDDPLKDWEDAPWLATGEVLCPVPLDDLLPVSEGAKELARTARIAANVRRDHPEVPLKVLQEELAAEGQQHPSGKTESEVLNIAVEIAIIMRAIDRQRTVRKWGETFEQDEALACQAAKLTGVFFIIEPFLRHEFDPLGSLAQDKEGRQRVTDTGLGITVSAFEGIDPEDRRSLSIGAQRTSEMLAAGPRYGIPEHIETAIQNL